MHSIIIISTDTIMDLLYSLAGCRKIVFWPNWRKIKQSFKFFHYNRMDYFREICTMKTNRYKKNGYNLDLSYITDNIIAMGLPAQSFRKIYKNPIN